jgi:microsomal epoxide hydrolase
LKDMASIMNNLMVSLGFGDGYIVQGGDVGSKVARVVASRHPECKALHINFCIMPEPKEIKSTISPEEAVGLQRANAFKSIGSAYALEHATKPSTIGFVLGSNPVSLLAWIGEKFLDWSDEDPPIEAILEAVSLYWFTDCAATALYPYRHLFTPGVVGAHENPEWYITKPFGFSWFPKELAPIPKAWAETTGDLIFWRQHSSGGHFAALEKPDELWQDIEAFVEQVWQR